MHFTSLLAQRLRAARLSLFRLRHVCWLLVIITGYVDKDGNQKDAVLNVSGLEASSADMHAARSSPRNSMRIATRHPGAEGDVCW